MINHIRAPPGLNEMQGGTKSSKDEPGDSRKILSAPFMPNVSQENSKETHFLPWQSLPN